MSCIFKIYTPAQVAEILQVPEKLILQEIHLKKLRAFWIGTNCRIFENDLNEYLQMKRECPNSVGSQQKKRGGRYKPLENYLSSCKESMVKMHFADIEKLIGRQLPPSATMHRAFWANTDKSHSQSASWMDAGWIVDSVDFANEIVKFCRVKKE